MEKLEQAIVELQSKVLFQEDALHKLDDAIVQQGKIIEGMLRKFAELDDKIEQLMFEGRPSVPTGDEKPPHY